MALSLAAASLIGAGIGATGNMITNGINIWENHKNRKFNAAEAQKQRDWETEMSNTAYQRAVKDMKEAGLNPAMMYGSGGAGMASTPSGASASSQPARINSLVADIGNLMNSITNAKALDIQRNKKSNIETTQQMYNNAGELLNFVVKQTRDL